RMDDRHGTAETLDLLGMTSFLSGELAKGAAFCRDAMTAFRSAEDRYGLASVLASLPLRGAIRLFDAALPDDTLAACLDDAESALTAMRGIGWRVGEAYALFNLSFTYCAIGECGRAVHAARESLKVAEEVGHRQWAVGALCALGAVYLDIL